MAMAGSLNVYAGILVMNSMAVVLNLITMIVIIASRKLRKTHNVFIWNIAFSDFTASFFNVFTILYRHFTGQFLAGPASTVMRTSYLTGICSTVSVALHRIAIIRFDPFNTRKLFTGPRCIFVCIIFWATFLIIFFMLQYYARRVYITISAFMPLLTFGAHCLCAVCYGLVYFTISGAARKAGLAGDTLKQRVKQNKSVLMTFALVVGTNILCWAPFCSRIVIGYVRPDWIPKTPSLDPTLWFKILENVAISFQGLNGILNPVIYFTRLSAFRQLLCAACSSYKNKRRSKNGESSQQTKETSSFAISAKM
ncbi:substance-P receptor-like [Lytechinus variegatus]|uniref:substance-P receptor-like n=1 Tax=Lytechinus variegatus TaxID=7654 RepID=UPI001BB2BD18|nr:substance-P receptor-like [Lytechinus variegatus]